MTEEIRLYASHRQFLIQDSEALGKTDDEFFWSEEAHHRRLAVADGIIGVGTASYDFVKIRMEHQLTAPELTLEEWDHVTECGLEVRTGRILVMSCISRSGLFTDVIPGHYRVRVCHANLDQSESEAGPKWDGTAGDWYLIQLWASPSLPLQILKQRCVL